MNVRATGTVESAAGLLPFGHLCWVFHDRREFLLAAADYLADGITAGQQVSYVAAAAPSRLRAELDRLGGTSRPGTDLGEVQVHPIDTFYRFAAGDGAVVDPQASVAGWQQTVEHALARGYTGVRAAIDCTALTRTAHQREAFIRYEHLIDRAMTTMPVSACCAYDRGQHTAEQIRELACLHPFDNLVETSRDPAPEAATTAVAVTSGPSGRTPFRLHGATGADFALTGEIDAGCGDLFDAVLGRALDSTSPIVTVDCSGLEFLDHGRLRTLDLAAGAHGIVATLCNANALVRRLVEIRPLHHVRAEAPR